ncbi:MAG: rhodanese-related sulfurtransferase [Verrucomicrobiota bacterium]|nr:rhodanese-related sulfurtransferase [Verrucomicrobiota bacterium]
MDYSVLAYYILVPIADPKLEVERHKDFFKERNFRGRIYISEEGINGQASGESSHAKEYMEWLASDSRFCDVRFKVHKAKEHPFPKMTVKYRKQLVALDVPVNLEERGESLSPQEWKRMLEKREPGTLLIDVRNEYEWRVGHFEGAELPALEQFRHFPHYAAQLKEKHSSDTPLMIYCTGGIRCEYYSSYLKREGFSRVYQLDGGVIQYGMDEGSKHWKGKLFVFDDRLVVPLDEEENVIAKCLHCDATCDTYHNCANMDCNELFVCCIDCLRENQGCCCPDCQKGRVRPYQESAKPFRKIRASETPSE